MPARLLALFFALLLALPAAARTGTAPPAPARAAAPSLWHVTGPAGEAWLFGSVHVLSPAIAWRTPPLEAAITGSDVFVFEVPRDGAADSRVRRMIAERGRLPPGVSLRDLLRPETQAQYDAAVAASGLVPEQVNRQRPWLAGLQILFAQMQRQQFTPAAGADMVLLDVARKSGKPVRYLESIDDQLALLAPDDPALELEEFESALTDLQDAGKAMAPLVTAWAKGDQQTLARIVRDDMEGFPAARKAMFDDRNARWVPRIAAMLKQKHRFFITVGAGHLAGPQGVPALLRKAGYRVEGP